MRLTEFIERNHEKILEEWVTFARTLNPWADGMTEEDLADHADELLSAIVRDMHTVQSRQEQARKSKGEVDSGALGTVGQKHAIERLQGGLKLEQLVSEYRALRASVLRLWEKSHGGEADEITRFNEAIDEALAESSQWYSAKVTRTREQFLAILGHDLRNPLGAILSGATILSQSESLGDKDARVATRILNSAGRMARMVSDLLDLTRTRLGAGIPITPTPMDLPSVCEQVIAELEPVHPECSLVFEATGDLRGEWDSDRLSQVISNLVANAVQYGGEDGPVTVRAQPHGGAVVLQVHNEGPPISAELQKKIFEPMVRDSTGNRNVGGMGLGLFIAREVVLAHGGTIDLVSTKKEGTTFTVQLPRKPPASSKSDRHDRGRAGDEDPRLDA